VVAGANLSERFTEEEQKIIAGVIHEAEEYHNGILETYESEYIRKLKQQGASFIDVNREAFEGMAREKLPGEFSGKWVPGIFDRIIATGQERLVLPYLTED
jgi:TRAP-type C4-dicarboxylate transport system substrate-binding protein